MATKASRIALAGSNISSTGEVDADLLDNIDSAAFLSLDSNGRLGIGTTNPDTQLEIQTTSYIGSNEVRGLLRLTGQSEVENGTGIPSAGAAIEFYNKWQNGSSYSMGRISGRAEQSYNGGLQFDVSDNTAAGQNNFTTAMSIDPDARVGIGVTNPSTKLHVDGNIRASGIYQEGGDSASSAFVASQGVNTSRASVAMWPKDHGSYPGQVHIVSHSANTSADSGKIMFWDYNGSSWNANGAWDKDGKLGIGLTDPISKLDISSIGSSTNPTVNITTTSSYQFNHVANAFAPNLAAAEGAILVIGRAGSLKNSGYIGYKYSGTPGSDDNIVSLGHWGRDWLLNVKGNGNVGIGTENPQSKLDVIGDINTNGNNIKLGGSNSLQIVGSDGSNGWDSKPGVMSQGAEEFRFHASSGDMDVWVDGYLRADKGVKGAFIQYDGYTEFTLTGSGASSTWSPTGLPGNVYVSASVFLSSTDTDQSDHFNVHFGPNAFSASTWGDTYPGGSNLPVTHAVYTNLGDAQDVQAGHYGAWGHAIFKTSSGGSIVSCIQGTNAGSGVAIRIQGYWMESSS